MTNRQATDFTLVLGSTPFQYQLTALARVTTIVVHGEGMSWDDAFAVDEDSGWAVISEATELPPSVSELYAISPFAGHAFEIERPMGFNPSRMLAGEASADAGRVTPAADVIRELRGRLQR